MAGDTFSTIVEMSDELVLDNFSVFALVEEADEFDVSFVCVWTDVLAVSSLLCWYVVTPRTRLPPMMPLRIGVIHESLRFCCSAFYRLVGLLIGDDEFVFVSS